MAWLLLEWLMIVDWINHEGQTNRSFTKTNELTLVGTQITIFAWYHLMKRQQNRNSSTLVSMANTLITVYHIYIYIYIYICNSIAIYNIYICINLIYILCIQIFIYYKNKTQTGPILYLKKIFISAGRAGPIVCLPEIPNCPKWSGSSSP